MASGRVGGTTSKKSGVVGGTIYQIRRNPDGTYSQIVTTKGERSVNLTTPRLQAQRMCTAMVESLMKQLKEVANISMQSAANKSKSLNAFSSFNLQLVAQDCKAHWYSGHRFVYPQHSDSYPDNVDLGGEFMLSSGTLQFDTFSRYQKLRGDEYDWPEVNNDHYAVGMMVWDLPSRTCTVGQLLSSLRMTRLDTNVFCAFKAYFDMPDDDEGEEVDSYKHCYAIIKPNPSISDGTIINRTSMSYVFSVKSNEDYIWSMKRDGSAIALCFRVNNWDDIGIWGYLGGFSISYLDGRKKISSRYYQNMSYGSDVWLNGAAPADVFGTWMGEPSRKPYPYIF